MSLTIPPKFSGVAVIKRTLPPVMSGATEIEPSVDVAEFRIYRDEVSEIPEEGILFPRRLGTNDAWIDPRLGGKQIIFNSKAAGELTGLMDRVTGIGENQLKTILKQVLDDAGEPSFTLKTIIERLENDGKRTPGKIPTGFAGMCGEHVMTEPAECRFQVYI